MHQYDYNVYGNDSWPGTTLRGCEVFPTTVCSASSSPPAPPPRTAAGWFPQLMPLNQLNWALNKRLLKYLQHVVVSIKGPVSTGSRVCSVLSCKHPQGCISNPVCCQLDPKSIVLHLHIFSQNVDRIDQGSMFSWSQWPSPSAAPAVKLATMSPCFYSSIHLTHPTTAVI